MVGVVRNGWEEVMQITKERLKECIDTYKKGIHVSAADRANAVTGLFFAADFIYKHYDSINALVEAREYFADGVNGEMQIKKPPCLCGACNDTTEVFIETHQARYGWIKELDYSDGDFIRLAVNKIAEISKDWYDHDKS